MLDERLAQEIKDTQQRMLNEGRLPTPAKLKQYYDTFRARFGPERLATLDGEALLDYMHNHGNRDGLVYWLEFKDDEEFPNIFGSIAGGSALKFGIYKSAQTGLWMTGFPKKQQTLDIPEAIGIARQHRDQFIRGCELLDALPVGASDNEYRALQEKLDTEAPDVSRLAWGHKYFSLIFPDKLDDYHAEYFQRFNLVKLLQVPPEGNGRYLCGGRFVGLVVDLDMPLNHLTTTLNHLHGKPYSYWRIGTTLGDERLDIWPDDRDGNFIAIGWDQIGDLSRFADGRELEAGVKEMLAELYPNDPRVIGRWARQIRHFANVGDYQSSINTGDLILAANGQTILGVGRVIGDYEYVAGAEFPHRRPVEWLSVDEWKLADREGLRTTVAVIRNYANQIEAERHVLEAHSAPDNRVATGGKTTSKSPNLTGVPGRIQAILARKGQVILYGPPGTGKTYWAELAARDLAAYSAFGLPFTELEDAQQNTIIDRYVRLCSFHPNYGYEDFLEGYRPEVADDQMTFERRDGIFKRLCEAAQSEPDHHFYLLIDEINRGDIPRIFGELLTVLEKDKRGKSIQLPLSEEPFSVPSNVYLIGTMNTADRSIALLDTALRRRFGFIELMPDYGVFGDTAVSGIPLGPWLEALNRAILDHVGRDARNLQIGHAYLLDGGKPVTSFAKFARMVQEDIIPLLEEYCYEDYTTLERILGRSLVDVRAQTINHELFSPARQDELIQALLAPFPEITTSIQAATSEEPDLDEIDEDDNGDTSEDA